VQRATRAVGVLVDVQVPVLAELPDRLGRVRQERGLAPEQPLVPGARRLEVADAVSGEQIHAPWTLDSRFDP
jgi:hypothetical protein